MKEYFFNKVINVVAKGDIAYYEQSLVLPQCLQMSPASVASESARLQESVNGSLHMDKQSVMASILVYGLSDHISPDSTFMSGYS